MTDNMTRQKIQLKDGRSLGYDEYGDPDGKPVFYFHGHPGSRIEWPQADKNNSAKGLNVRIIAVDRPGHGISDFKRGRELLDWPDDVVELADALQIDRFAVLGISGGGPFAASCAYKIPERLTATAIVSGMGPQNAPGAKDGLSWIYAGMGSLMRRAMLLLMSFGMRKGPDKVISKMSEELKGPDREYLLESPMVAKGILDAFAEAFQPGIAGVHQEAGFLGRSWGFRLEEIATDVHLWHGEQDGNVLVSVGRHVAGAIPNCKANFIEGEGHISLIHRYTREYLSVLVE